MKLIKNKRKKKSTKNPQVRKFLQLQDESQLEAKKSFGKKNIKVSVQPIKEI